MVTEWTFHCYIFIFKRTQDSYHKDYSVYISVIFHSIAVFLDFCFDVLSGTVLRGTSVPYHWWYRTVSVPVHTGTHKNTGIP